MQIYLYMLEVKSHLLPYIESTGAMNTSRTMDELRRSLSMILQNKIAIPFHKDETLCIMLSMILISTFKTMSKDSQIQRIEDLQMIFQGLFSYQQISISKRFFEFPLAYLFDRTLIEIEEVLKSHFDQSKIPHRNVSEALKNITQLKFTETTVWNYEFPKIYEQRHFGREIEFDLLKGTLQVSGFAYQDPDKDAVFPLKEDEHFFEAFGNSEFDQVVMALHEMFKEYHLQSGDELNYVKFRKGCNKSLHN